MVVIQTTKVRATVWRKFLVKMEDARNLWVADINRKRIPIDLNVLRLKASSPYEDCSKRSLKQVATSHLQVRDGCTDPGIGLDKKI